MVSSRPVAPRQPKSKAKDPHKRPMSLEEKEKLVEGLQSLPQEKMELVVQIVKRRSSDMVQDGDEIELDFEAMDPDALWELYWFVANCKKMMSKVGRQEAVANPNPNPDHTGSEFLSSSLAAQVAEKPPTGGDAQNTSAGKRMKRGGDTGEEDVDVDIGEEMPSANYPSVEIEKDNAASSSSSSSSDESSSSGYNM